VKGKEEEIKCVLFLRIFDTFLRTGKGIYVCSRYMDSLQQAKGRQTQIQNPLAIPNTCL